jgi:hypothetical protein
MATPLAGASVRDLFSVLILESLSFGIEPIDKARGGSNKISGFAELNGCRRWQ